ncbi:MAG: acyl-CoA dehydrogenase family protein [Pseudomonadota bacterium]
MLSGIEEAEEFRSYIAKWTDERLMPHAEEIDVAGDFPRELAQELGELGYIGTMYPESAGGSGLEYPNLCFAILCEELSRASVGFAAWICMQGSTATHTIYEWGNDYLREKYFHPALKGEKICAFAISEPGAGSDAASVRTKATKVDGGWVINGSKMFTSNGTVADFITVVASTDLSKGAKGLELFVVDTSFDGFSVSNKLDKMSVRSSDTAALSFDEMFVPDDHMLSSETGNGFRNAYRSLTVDRIFTAALAVGNARAAYESARNYAQDREQFGQPIVNFQAVDFRLVDMLANVELMTMYTYHAAKLADQGDDITVEAALAKLIAGEKGHQVCHDAVNVYGGWGLMNEYPVQRFLRDSYFPMVGGGTMDIMRMIIGRRANRAK